MHPVHLSFVVLVFITCLVCGLVLYSMCIKRMYRKCMSRCTLQTAHKIIDMILGNRSLDRMDMIESTICIPNMRVLILDTHKRCWLDTNMPHLAHNASTGERPGEILHVRNQYDTIQDPIDTMINVATRANEGGFVEYENDMGEYKEWVYTFSKQLTLDKKYILCVELKSSSNRTDTTEDVPHLQ